MFLKASELEPNDANVWLWLASISEYPEELMSFVDKVLNIDPYNERAIQWRTATQALLAKTFVQRGTDAAESDQPMYAEDCFAKALEYDPQNTTAMLWLASLSSDDKVRLEYLNRIIEIDPSHEAAKNALSSIALEEEKTEFARIREAAASGNVENSVALLREFTTKHQANVDGWMLLSHLLPNPAEKLDVLETILELDPDNAAARVSFDSISSIFGDVRTRPSDESVALPLFDVPVEESENMAAAEEVEEIEQPEVFEAPAAFEDSVNMEASEVTHDFTSPDVLEENTFEESANISAVEDVYESYEPEAFEAPAALEDSVNMNATEEVHETYEPEAIEAPRAFEDLGAPIYAPMEELVFEPIASSADEVPQTIAVSADDAAEFQYQKTQFPEQVDDWDRRTESYEAEEVAMPALFEEAPSHVEIGEEVESIPMPDDFFPGTDIVPERTGFETVVEPQMAESNGHSETCPFCSFGNDQHAFICGSCFAVVSLSELESMMSNKSVDTFVVRRFVDGLESERSQRELSHDELYRLGIGHLNLRNLQFGYDRLLEVSRAKPDDIMLSNHVNSLLIRMNEIREQEQVHADMVSGKKILVVDDSVTIRKLIAGKLEKCGHEVFLCENGSDAIKHIESNLPDLILLDISMPGIDGYEVCRHIRSRAESANLPVVMISGKDGFFDKMRGRMAGSTGYITKPFGPETLMKSIEFYLNGGKDGEYENDQVETVH